MKKMMYKVFDKAHFDGIAWAFMPKPKTIEIGGYVFPVSEIPHMEGAAFVDITGKYEPIGFETKATNTAHPEGKDVQDRANDSGEQTGMGEGKD
jgi:hypothetical protein